MRLLTSRSQVRISDVVGSLHFKELLFVVFSQVFAKPSFASVFSFSINMFYIGLGEIFNLF